ncbi:MAG: NAD(P)H-dependent oxidoreductase [Dehalococcoidales bacterium]|nr:NAD(P)H-dependent oxidoreductase [Dehalococcoidales bacterium]
MKILVLLAHPDKTSFNHAIAEVAIETLTADEHEVAFHDLYREKFPATLPVQEIPRGASLPRIISRHCSEVVKADGIIIIHPNWWGQPPAILKGWIDRVLRPGVAYTFAEGDSGDGELIGLLKANMVMVFNTSNTPVDRELNLYGDPLETLWKNNMLISCGVKNFYRRNFGVIVTSTLKQRRIWLKEVREITNKCFPRGL